MYVLPAERCLHNLPVLGFINRCTQARNHIPVLPVSVIVHERIHTFTGVKPCACSACGKMFTQTILKFMSGSTQVLSRNCYACSTCGKMFTQDRYLKMHERIHTVVSRMHFLHAERRTIYYFKLVASRLANCCANTQTCAITCEPVLQFSWYIRSL